MVNILSFLYFLCTVDSFFFLSISFPSQIFSPLLGKSCFTPRMLIFFVSLFPPHGTPLLGGPLLPLLLDSFGQFRCEYKFIFCFFLFLTLELAFTSKSMQFSFSPIFLIIFVWRFCFYTMMKSLSLSCSFFLFPFSFFISFSSLYIFPSEK